MTTVPSSLALVQGARKGDPAALEGLCARYIPRLRAWAHGRLPPRARGHMDTDDIVQDALVRTLHRLDQLDSARLGCFQAYTRQAVLNAIRDRLRRARPAGDPSVELARAEHPDPSPLEEAIGREALARYDDALQRLSKLDREMVVARIEFHCDYEEIAELTGKRSVAAARMGVRRALMRLAREMGHAAR